MDQKKYQVILGCLLHDTGKISHRAYDRRNHSLSGKEFIEKELNISDPILGEMVFHHHYDFLKHARFKEDHPAYISYIADNIASFSDRRDSKDQGVGFDWKMNLQSVFNLLNDNTAKGSYDAKVLDNNKPIYPKDSPSLMSQEFYQRILDNLKDNLKGMEPSKDYLESYLQTLEANLTYVPSSTSKSEQADISLYHHVKLTAAIGSAIFDYLDEGENYRERLFKGARDFYQEEVFLFVSLDLSGIQRFIYSIINQSALKALRSRSLYLELIMEGIIDEILSRLDLTRANLVFSGGGHAYLLVANTDREKAVLEDIRKEVNKWMMDLFGVDLYLTLAYTPATANHFRDEPAGSYPNLFQKNSEELSRQKLHRYEAEDIKWLNEKMIPDKERECKICHRTDRLNEDAICEICTSIIDASAKIGTHSHFVIYNQRLKKAGWELPFHQWIYPVTKKELLTLMQEDGYIRSYSKNQFYQGKKVSTNLWIGDYSYHSLLEALREGESGIHRLAAMRADVDSLGVTFQRGFVRQEYGVESNRFVTLSRSATLSGMLSMFFKSNINHLLENPTYHVIGTTNEGPRKAVVIYSGGDDLFVVGNWHDIIGFAVDLNQSLKRFTQNSLTLSAGIGIFPVNYPVSYMAKETEKLENAAKAFKREIDEKVVQKNAVSIFEEKMTFSWDQLTQRVLEGKLKDIDAYIKATYEDQGEGSSMLYRILELIRNPENPINLPRLLYTVTRKSARTDEGKNVVNNFCQKLYVWIKNPTDCKELEMALTLYVIMNRGEE